MLKERLVLNKAQISKAMKIQGAFTAKRSPQKANREIENIAMGDDRT